ncbi:hypothetical protein NLJ89_g9813 [Agrocybe chaxingu]|uniref:DUF7053 domain-containing protein n=1 Tax=Agrocybe chaxingu TaxID=84603 RepID=A0A9W8JSS8_9AGAR|nr:hypothetical protein NLJ89_g9813 [Agrocybe chaxingu]
MSLFFSAHTITLEKHIVGATNAALLDLLHDPLQVLRLSPLVYKVEQDATDPAWYTITERLPLLGGMLTTSTTFRCRYRETEDGCECEVLAGLGTRLTSSMFGHAADDGERKGGVVYTERLAVKVGAQQRGTDSEAQRRPRPSIGRLFLAPAIEPAPAPIVHPGRTQIRMPVARDIRC